MNERIAATAYTHAVAVTPNDSANLASPARALYVGSAGAIVVDTTGGETSVTIAAVPAGTTLPLSVQRVRATGTTAASIVALR